MPAVRSRLWGLSWQVVPGRLKELLSDPDAGRAHRAMQAMLRMGKIEIATLEAAAEGRSPVDSGVGG